MSAPIHNCACPLSSPCTSYVEIYVRASPRMYPHTSAHLPCPCAVYPRPLVSIRSAPSLLNTQGRPAYIPGVSIFLVRLPPDTYPSSFVNLPSDHAYFVRPEPPHSPLPRIMAPAPFGDRARRTALHQETLFQRLLFCRIELTE